MKVGVLATMIAILFAAGIPFAAIAGPTPDTDSDGAQDLVDFCSADALAPSPRACDTDLDGYGNSCDADYNNDGIVGAPDFPTFVNAFGTTGAPGFHVADHNCDGVVGAPDFPTFSSSFGNPPGPSGLPCAGTITCP